MVFPRRASRDPTQAGRWESRINVIIDEKFIRLKTAVFWTGERAPTLAAVAIERMANGIAIDDYKDLIKWLGREYAAPGGTKKRRKRFLLF